MILKNSTTEFNNVTGCNVTNSTVPEIKPYDAEGAMKFTVAVVMVYGVAVIGVFAVSYASRRKPVNYDVDRQARYFVKNMDDVRTNLERKNRLISINMLLKNIHGGSVQPKTKQKSIQEGILSYVAFPVMVVSGGATKNSNESEDTNVSSAVTPTSINSDYFSRETLQVLTEENENDENDDFFMNDDEKQKSKSDSFVTVS
ncbi:unnamed protein product [Mytilus coruscus]|uniref:Transmembrane protein n=1 Tax=Mytilus coruscus TaxID=42192 RepID=A0A6J8D846_MYTCO|nr:unnamed protein product [Mytilus coruscus]